MAWHSAPIPLQTFQITNNRNEKKKCSLQQCIIAHYCDSAIIIFIFPYLGRLFISFVPAILNVTEIVRCSRIWQKKCQEKTNAMDWIFAPVPPIVRRCIAFSRFNAKSVKLCFQILNFIFAPPTQGIQLCPVLISIFILNNSYRFIHSPQKCRRSLTVSSR